MFRSPYVISFLLLFFLQLLLQFTTIRSNIQTAKVFSDNVLWTILSRDVTDFQDYIDNYDDISFISTNIDGSLLAQSIADKISYKLHDYASAVKKLRDGVVKSYKKSSQPSHNVAVCGPSVLQTAIFDDRFDYQVDTNMMCTTTNWTRFNNYNTDQLFAAMSSNLNANNSAVDVKFQYFGREDGQCIAYPATPTVSYGYDPRFRPWYMGTAIPELKDVVLIIDLTQSMTRTYSAGQRTFLNVAQEVTSTIVDTLNNGDRVGVIGFSNNLTLPSYINSCYGDMLALATPVNKANLEEFIMSLKPSTNQSVDFTDAFDTAFQLLATESDGNDSATNATKRSKMILLFTDGDINQPGVENNNNTDCLRKLQNMYSKYNIRVDFHTFAFGTALATSASQLLNSITELNPLNKPGVNVTINDPDKSRQEISPFVSYYARSNASEPIFTPPYTDAFGLGSIISVCLPVNINEEFEGVTCADIVMNSLFSEVAYFQQSPLSYAFLIDDEGHVLLHPLLPQPQTANDKPLVLDILDLETGEAAKEVKKGILSGYSGNISAVANMYSPRGDDVSYGMDTFTVRVTYFWYPVNNSRFSICIVLADDLQNHTIQWKNTDNIYSSLYPAEKLCQNLDQYNPTTEECNRLGSIAFKDTSCIHIAPRGFVQPFAYLENNISFESNCTNKLTDILSGFGKNPDRSCPGDLTTQPGVLDSTAASKQLETIWRSSTNPDSSYVIARYIGDSNGVFRGFPGVVLKKDYDPTIRPWFVKAVANPGKVIISAPYVDAGGAGTVLTVSRNVAVKRSNATSDDKRESDPIWAVSGLDFTLAYFYSLIKEQFGPCNGLECFVIDASGIIVVHEQFFAVTSPVIVQSVHITTFEPDIAKDLIKSLIMTRSSCVRFDTITKMNYWQVHLLPLDNGLHSSSLYDMYDISASNIFIIVKKKAGTSNNFTWSCNNKDSNNDPVQCQGRTACECPCYTDTGFDFCRSMFNRDEEVWGPCPWPVKPIVGSLLEFSSSSPITDATKFTPCYPQVCPDNCEFAWQCEKNPSCKWQEATSTCIPKINKYVHTGEIPVQNSDTLPVIIATVVIGALMVCVAFVLGFWKGRTHCGAYSERSSNRVSTELIAPDSNDSEPTTNSSPDHTYEHISRVSTNSNIANRVPAVINVINEDTLVIMQPSETRRQPPECELITSTSTNNINDNQTDPKVIASSATDTTGPKVVATSVTDDTEVKVVESSVTDITEPKVVATSVTDNTEVKVAESSVTDNTELNVAVSRSPRKENDYTK